MPDDPTAPALEMTATQVATQRLTLRVVVEQIRAEMAASKSETDGKLAALMVQMEHALSRIDEVQALAMAMGERRTEDLRRMIHEEVAAQVAPVLDSLKTLTEVTPLLPILQQIVSEYTQRAGVQASHERQLTALLRALDTVAAGLERGGGSVKPLVYAAIGVVIAANGRTILAWPSWTFWAAVALLVGGAIVWNGVRRVLSRTLAGRVKAKP